MKYILVAIENLFDAVDTAKELEKRQGIHRAIVVRDSSERTPTDQYVCTVHTTALALARFNEGDERARRSH